MRDERILMSQDKNLRKRHMKGAILVRFICVLSLWLLLCYLLLSQRTFTLWTLFVIIASGIIIFVPLYKKHIRDGKGK